MIAGITVIGCLVLSILAITIPVAVGVCLANGSGNIIVVICLFIAMVIEFFGLFFLLLWFCEII